MIFLVLNRPLFFEDSSNVLFLESILHYKLLRSVNFKILYFFQFTKPASKHLINEQVLMIEQLRT